MSNPMDTLRAACERCGYTGTLRALSLHSCEIAENGGRCEDYPACGHIDGDGCQTLPEHTSAFYYDNPHLLGDEYDERHVDERDTDPADCEHNTDRAHVDRSLLADGIVRCDVCETTIGTWALMHDEESKAEYDENDDVVALWGPAADEPKCWCGLPASVLLAAREEVARNGADVSCFEHTGEFDTWEFLPGWNWDKAMDGLR